MAREAGLDVSVDPDLKEKLQELRYLQHSIGPTGLLALKPLRVTSERDIWHAYLLEQAGEGAHAPIRRVWRFLRRHFEAPAPR